MNQPAPVGWPYWRGCPTVSTSIVLIVLAAGWGGYLIVWWRDSRRVATGRSDRIRSFSSGMGTLGGSTTPTVTSGGSSATLAPRTAIEAARRRQQVLTLLAGFAIVTLLAAVALGALAWLVHFAADIVLAAYGYAVLQRRNLAAEREIKVQMLYPEGVTPIHTPRRQTVNG